MSSAVVVRGRMNVGRRSVRVAAFLLKIEERVNMKNKFLATFVCLALLVPAVFLAAAYLYPDTVAVVNGSSISSTTLDRKYDEALSRLKASGQLPDEDKLKKDVLESLINSELIYQESIRLGHSANALKIEMQYSNIKQQFGTERQFLDSLAERGYTEESLREELGRVMAIDEYIGAEVAPKVSVPEEMILSYYEENLQVFHEPEAVKASHILVRVDDPSDEQRKKDALKKIKNLKRRLQKGDDFEALAREYSDCPSKGDGGNLGFFTRGQMVEPFEIAAFALEEGETSDIVETRFGYHLIKLFVKRPERTVPFEEARGEIEQWLGEQKIFEEIRLLVERLKKEAKIERYL